MAARTAADELDAFLKAALAEDVGSGDVTAETTIEPHERARGILRLRDAGTVGGLAAALRVFTLLDPKATAVAKAADGDRVPAGAVVGVVEGAARAVVTGERVALNLLGRLSGIATLTRRYVDAVAGTPVAIVDTRKTTPLLRRLEKDAVRAGGGKNHRFGLFDAVLVKDNHVLMRGATGSADKIHALTKRILERVAKGTFVQIEATTLDEALAAVKAGADSVLFDNFEPGALAAAVPKVRAAAAGRAVVLEASGGINLDTVAAFARTGVDRISVGALTHGARSLDVTLDLEPL
jgi:nicotinate-nucleotide pyrophosphorylase (carboxylating)